MEYFDMSESVQVTSVSVALAACQCWAWDLQYLMVQICAVRLPCCSTTSIASKLMWGVLRRRSAMPSSATGRVTRARTQCIL